MRCGRCDILVKVDGVPIFGESIFVYGESPTTKKIRFLPVLNETPTNKRVRLYRRI